MWESDERFHSVKTAELELLSNATRHSAVRVTELLHPDFVEIGRSGRRWTREETIAALAGEDEHAEPETDEWLFNDIGDGLVLLTYRITTPSARSRHSSIWDLNGNSPAIRYHQGTVQRDESFN